MVGTIGRDIFSLKYTHVAAGKVIVAVAVGRRPSKISQSGKAAEIGDRVQFHIKTLTDTCWTWSEDVSPRSQAARNGDWVGIPCGYGCYSRCCNEGDTVRRSKMFGEQFLRVEFGLSLTGCHEKKKASADTSQPPCHAQPRPAPVKVWRRINRSHEHSDLLLFVLYCPRIGPPNAWIVPRSGTLCVENSPNMASIVFPAEPRVNWNFSSWTFQVD